MLVSYTLMLLSIFVLTIVLLNRLINPGRNPVHIVLAICVLVTILTGFTLVAGPVTIYKIRSNQWSFLDQEQMVRFYVIRMLFFTVSLISAWLTYRAVKSNGHQAALRWAFVLENVMLLSALLTLFVLYTHVTSARLTSERPGTT